jgi:hypothetical protein
MDCTVLLAFANVHTGMHLGIDKLRRKGNSGVLERTAIGESNWFSSVQSKDALSKEERSGH